MEQLQAHKAVIGEFGFALGGAYIQEAEHQDGPEYWQRFDTVEGLLVDVQLYFLFKENVGEF